MKISELPKKYRALLEQRVQDNGGWEQADQGYATDCIQSAFKWDETPEGFFFWLACHNAETEDELPDIAPGRTLLEYFVNQTIDKSRLN